jgi:hypothetical protein
MTESGGGTVAWRAVVIAEAEMAPEDDPDGWSSGVGSGGEAEEEEVGTGTTAKECVGRVGGGEGAGSTSMLRAS